MRWVGEMGVWVTKWLCMQVRGFLSINSLRRRVRDGWDLKDIITLPSAISFYFSKLAQSLIAARGFIGGTLGGSMYVQAGKRAVEWSEDLCLSRAGFLCCKLAEDSYALGGFLKLRR